MTSQTKKNLDYYGELAAGRSDYWRLMAAPRFRVKTILRALAEERPGSVIDIGCGNGALLFAIARIVPETKLAGIDLSAAQIEANREKFPEIEWNAGNVEGETFALPHKYAAIVASELIEHLAEPVEFLHRLHDYAEEGALLVLSTQSGRVGETERRVGHLRHFSAAEMSDMLEKAEWTPIRVWNAGWPFQDLSKYLANLSPDKSMEHFAERRYGLMERFAAFVLRVLFLFNSNKRGAQLFAIARKR